MAAALGAGGALGGPLPRGVAEQGLPLSRCLRQKLGVRQSRGERIRLGHCSPKDMVHIALAFLG